MKVQWSHVAMGACSALAALSEVGAQYVKAGDPLPFHLTAGAALAVCTFLGMFSKSILADSSSAAGGK